MAQGKKSNEADEKDKAPKSQKKLLIGIIALLVAIIAGGASWYFMAGKDAHQAAYVPPPKTPIFLALEPFTVNLQREATDQYLQLGLSFKYFDASNEAKLKQSLPEIRGRILQLLTTKTATELLTAEGKNKLIQEIITVTNGVIGIVNEVPQPIPGVAQQMPGIPQQQVAMPGQPLPPAVNGLDPATQAPLYPQQPVEKKGVVDVLFTSFIIQ